MGKAGKIAKGRFASLDAYRGFAIGLMLFFNFFPLLSYGAPFFLLHNQGNTLLFGDLVAPMFQFMVGVSLALSLAKRKKERRPENGTISHTLQRFGLLVVLGLVLDALTYVNPITWGVLETLGLAGMVAFFLRNKSDAQIILFSLILLAAYAFASTQPIVLSLISGLPHGGPIGALSFTVITLGGMVLGRHLLAGRRDLGKNILIASLLLMAAGACLSLFIPFNKLLVSTSYSVFATGSSVFIFLLFYQLVEIGKLRLVQLNELGRRALGLWTMQFILIFWPLYFIFKKTNFLGIYEGAVLSALLVAAFYLLSGFLERRGLKMAL